MMKPTSPSNLTPRKQNLVCNCAFLVVYGIFPSQVPLCLSPSKRFLFILFLRIISQLGSPFNINYKIYQSLLQMDNSLA